MISEVVNAFGKAGLAGLGLATVLILFRYLLSDVLHNAIPKLSRQQAYRVIMTFMTFCFLLAAASLVKNKTDTIESAPATEKDAQKLINHLLAGEYQLMYSMFSDPLKSNFPPAAIRAHWGIVINCLGEPNIITEPVNTSPASLANTSHRQFMSAYNGELGNGTVWINFGVYGFNG